MRLSRAIVIVSILAMALLFLLVFKRPRPLRAPDRLTTGGSAVLLAYPLRHGGWTQIERSLADVPKTTEDRVRRIVRELSAVPPDAEAAVFSPLPETFPLRSVYLDGSRLYLDLAHEALDDFSGGTEEELLALESLKQSVALNLPDLDQLQILVDGLPRRTLGVAGEDAGHISILQPIRLKK